MFKTILTGVLALSAGAALAQPAPPSPKPALNATVATVGKYQIELRLPDGGLRAGETIHLEFRLTDMTGHDAAGNDRGVPLASPTASVTMPAMPGMPVARPAVRGGSVPGDYRIGLSFPHGGEFKIGLRLTPPGDKPLAASFVVHVNDADGSAPDTGEGMGGMDMTMGAMKGVLGPWSMAREGSGTTWLPDDSPMFMRTLPKAGRYDLMYMGDFSLNYTDSNVGGGRGPHEFYSNSMPMLMARRDVGGGTLGFRLMGSLDPVFNGEFGAPNLFQTGESAHGQTLVDRQHPHDLLAEVSATYSHPMGGDARGFVYLAPIGEPALGASMYLMRPSGMENPEAPISHHWFDSTHIAFGVATAGVTLGDRWKVEGSAFKGREPDENRYVPDSIKLDSAAARLTYNPSRALSMSVSYGTLKSPESSAPGQNQNRTAGAVHYGRALRDGDYAAATAYFGLDAQAGHTTDAYLLEGTYFRRDWSYYARLENVAKDELENVPAGDYRIGKLTFGATRDFAHKKGFDLGVGAYAGLYSFPSRLDDAYGKAPATLGVYLRIRPSRMEHGAGAVKGMSGMPGMDMKP